jgi:hypothetical protein
MGVICKPSPQHSRRAARLDRAPSTVHRVGAELLKRFTLELPALAEREP